MLNTYKLITMIFKVFFAKTTILWFNKNYKATYVEKWMIAKEY